MTKILLAVFIMAIVTYIPRALPITAMTRKIESPFIKSFLYYIPYAVLAAMTFPAILSATSSTYFSIIGLVVGVCLAYRGQGLFKVAMGTVLTVYLCEMLFPGL
ncbi:MAG: AzlD domain-containing protein [Firmicutes bacterium]|nr:AzlD domain-containing protein [Bacillota bacterium]